MADKGGDKELPQRFRGEARAATSPSGSPVAPVLSAELRRRLETRGTETPESLLARVNKASYEISFKHHFDLIIVNDHLEKACREADEAVKSFLGL